MATNTQYDIWYGPAEDRRHVLAATKKDAQAALKDLERSKLDVEVEVTKIATTTEVVTL